MSVLAAAGRSFGLAARFACSTKPKLRCGRPSVSSKQCYTFIRCARICTRVAASQARAATSETRDSIKAAHSAFYAPEGVNFDDLTLNTAVVHALQQAGFARPSTVQELAVPSISQGRSVVLAAETGSGKTVTYLAPVISQLLQQQQGRTMPAAVDRDRDIVPGALVLCPNVALCQQVKQVADSLVDSKGEPLLTTAQISSTAPPPFDIPDIVVTTPASLINCTEGSHFGPEWSRGGILARMHHVVLDEADLLLSGAYERDVQRILDGMKQSDRERKAQQVSKELGIPLEAFQALPRHLKAAAYEGGVQAMLDAGFDRPDAQAGVPEDLLVPSTSAPSAAPQDRQFERQYIFVAATMPSEGKKSVAAELQHKFPRLLWLAGRHLHEGLSTIKWHWLPTDPHSWRSTFQDTVTNLLKGQKTEERILVFAGSVAAANTAAKALEEVRVNVLLYHKEVPAKKRAEALTAISQQGGVMVCTDAAARGIDIPHVTHVIQADFAASAVEFLHRVGRTARQGLSGEVTSLYSPDRQHLAEAVKNAIEADQPIEGAFSRNRSFAKKFRKYGQYVPRGQTLTA